MASNQLKQVPEVDEMEDLTPLTPISHAINNSILSLTINVVAEFENPVNKSQTVELLRDVLVPVHPTFSSIIVTDDKGVQRWKKVELTIEDQVIVPTFPSGLSIDEYDSHFYEYLSEITMGRLPDNRPPWEVHVIMYPTSNAAGSLVFRLNHALGDGYAFVSAFVSCFKRADNPSLPLTFPVSTSESRRPGQSNWSKISSFLSKFLNTVTDSSMSMLRGTFLRDDKSPIRSETPQVEIMPKAISSVTFDLDQIRQIKSKFGTTINDVILGLIFYATQLYMQKMGVLSNDGSMTALVVLNMRMLEGYKNIEEMIKAKIWGNHFGFLDIPFPPFIDTENTDPLQFVVHTKKNMDKKKNSAAVYFSAKIMNWMMSIFGPKAAARFIHSSIANTSIGITSVIGPTQKATLLDHPVNGFYFTLSGVPLSVVFTISTYMGKLRIIATTEKGFIKSNIFVACLKEAFEKFLEVVCENEAVESS